MKRISSLVFILFLFKGVVICQIGEVLNEFQCQNDYSPSGLTFDGQYLWEINYSKDSVYKMDPATHEIIKAFDSPDYTPRGLGWDGKNIWLSGGYDTSFYKLDTSDFSIIKQMDCPTGTPRDITLINGDLWYADSPLKMIYSVDTAAGTLLDSMPTPGGAARGMAWDGKYLWNCDASRDEIYKIDITRKKIIHSYTSPATYSYGLAHDGSEIWVAGYDSYSIHNLSVTGTNWMQKTDSLEANIEYYKSYQNIGATDMTLNCYFGKPYSSEGQKITGDIEWATPPSQELTDKYGSIVNHFEDVVVEPGDSFVVNWNMNVKTYSLKYYIDPDSVGTIGEIPASIINEYATDEANYDINDTEIQNTVAAVAGSESNLYWKIRALHDFVIDTITYNLDGIHDTATQVLLQGHGSCSEYTYLFSGLCRAAGIPTRYERGTTCKTDTLPYQDEVFHRWQQIYIPPYGWVYFDATWDDKTNPADQIDYFGATSKKLFADYLGGGDSEFLKWSSARTTYSGGGYSNPQTWFYWSEPKGNTVIELRRKADNELFSVFPNPGNGRITIQITDERNLVDALCMLELYDISGRFLLRQEITVNKQQIDLSRLSKGTYLIRLINGQENQTRRFIIQ